MSTVKTISKFQNLLKKFNSIYRDCESLHDKNSFDNDIEHSYRVAMICWMIINEYNFKLDIDKVLKYSLVHDFVEVYAGDISMYKNNSQIEKEKKEHKAFLKLKKEFPKQENIWDFIEEYEKREDRESRFVYMIEKLEPGFLCLLSAPDHFLKRNISFEDFFERKQRKIKDLDEEFQVFNRDLMNYWKKRKNTHFVTN